MQAKQMLKDGAESSQIDEFTFQVPSQTAPNKFYMVSRTGHGLVCECSDHQESNSDCKHIRVILEQLKQNAFDNSGYFRIINRTNIIECKCGSKHVTKMTRRKNKRGWAQRYLCKECEVSFVSNTGFEKKHFEKHIITGALQMYFTGMSFRDIAGFYEMQGTSVSHKTIYNWVSEYSKLIAQYLLGIIPRVGRTFRADEVYMRVAGLRAYLFGAMDNATRYWLAGVMYPKKDIKHCDELLVATKLQAGCPPLTFITDGHWPYESSCRRIFGTGVEHIRNITLAGERNNNAMERLNGEIRDREKVFRGLKKMDTSIIDGMRIYYNHARKHIGLGGITPGEAAGILIDGKDKWLPLIQNAALNNMA